MHAPTHIQRADAYLSFVLDCPVGPDVRSGLQSRESGRRLRPEEGYAAAWPICVLRKGDAWWVSAAPGLPRKVSSAVAAARGDPGFGPSLIARIRRALPGEWAVRWHHSLLFVPPREARAADNPAGCLIRPMTLAEKPRRSVPEESVALGTAFGAFVGGELASWAEATPLPTVTERFGVMLVGIETRVAFRRRGYARAALAALTREVVGRGLTPLYGCAATNVASARTARSCGYAQYGEMLRFEVESGG